MRGEGEPDRVGQTPRGQPLDVVLGAAGSVGADQDLLRPPPAPAQQGWRELGESLARDGDVIGGGVRSRVARAQGYGEGFPGAGLSVIEERA